MTRRRNAMLAAALLVWSFVGVAWAEGPVRDPERVAAVLEEVLAEQIPNADTRPALGIAVATGTGLLAQRVVGLADLELGAPATTASRFDWASVAKQTTAFAVSLLIEDGALSLDDSVARFLPELEGLGVDLRVRHLVHHTSGLEDVDGLLALSGLRRADDVRFEDLVALLGRQRHLRFFPGTQHAYSNGGYVLLAAMVERVTGEPFEAWMQRRVFGPLGMEGAAVRRDASWLIPGRVRSYAHDARDDVDRLDRSAPTPGAGSLVATVADLGRWAAQLLEPRRDHAATLRLRERGRLADGTRLDYAWGLGWGIARGVETLGHAGSGPGDSSQVLLFPDLDLAIVAASASSLDPGAGAVVRAVADRLLAGVLEEPEAGPRRFLMVTAEMLDEPPPDVEVVDASEATIRAAVGVYRYDDGRRVVVRARPGALELAPRGQPPWFPLYPVADGGFVLGALLDRVTFPLDPSTGRARELVRELTPASRLQAGEPRRVAHRVAVELDREAAERYVGDYWSPELRTVHSVRLRESRGTGGQEPVELVLDHPRHGELPLAPLGDHEFGVDSREVAGARFAVDPVSGRALGVELEAYSWGVKTSFRRLEHALEGDPPP